MAKTEIDAIKSVDTALKDIDQAACKRVLEWAWNKYVPESLPPAKLVSPKKSSPKPKKKGGNKGAKAIVKKKKLTIVNDLNLRPKNKKSFMDFVGEKLPSSYSEKCTVSAYYLEKVIKVKAISTNHIYTCFKDATWRIPANLNNKLAQIATTKAWLDVIDREDIKVTTHGENLVEHDLPKNEK